MKKKLSILLVAVLSFAMVATTAFADVGSSEPLPSMQMSASTTGESLDAAVAGDTVTVVVKAPAVAMCALQFKVNFDTNVFEYDDYECYESTKKWLSTEIGEDNASKGKIGYAASKGENKTPDAEWEILTIVLKVKDSATAGETCITMNDLQAFHFAYGSEGSSEFQIQSAAAIKVTIPGTTGEPSTGTPTTGTPTTGEPTTGTPTTGNPTTGNPTTGNPTTGNPTTGNPTTGTPTTGTPTTGNPTTGNPTTGNPTTGNPTTGNPTTGNPTTGNPTTGNPTTGNPTTGNPTTGNPTTGNPTTGNPTTGNPTTGNPTTGNPTTGNPTTGNPTTGNPTTGDPTTGNPTTGNPTTGNPTTGNPTTGNPTTGNPTTGNPTTGNPTTGDPTTGNPTTGNPTTGNPTTGNPTTGNPTTGNPTTGNPTTGNPTTGEPTTNPTPGGGAIGGGGAFIPVATPGTTYDKTQGDVTISADGKTATITPKDGYEIDTVTVNGVNMGAVNSLTGLKSTDKIVVTFKQSFDLAAYLEDLQLVARSAKTSKGNVKVTIVSVKDSNGNDVDLSVLEDMGYTVEYKFYRSVKKSSKYKATVSKPLTDNTYTNTTGEKGTRYYYKARIVVKDANGNVVGQTELKQCKYACRVWSKK